MDAMEDVYHERLYLIDMISVANLDILQQNLPEDIVQPNSPKHKLACMVRADIVPSGGPG